MKNFLIGVLATYSALITFAAYGYQNDTKKLEKELEELKSNQ